MGQVAYALTTDNIEEAAERLGITSTYQLRSMPVYFKVPIGAVNLTPNREGLLFDDKTNALIDTLIKEYLESVKVSAQAEVDAIENRQEVYAAAAKWTERLGLPMQWNGVDIVTEVKTATPSSTIKRTSWDKSTHGSTYSVRLDQRHDYHKIIVTGKPFDKYKRMSNYITDYMAMMTHSSGATFYFREALDELDNEWVTDNPNITFEDFEDMIQRVKDHRKAERAAAKALLPKELRDRSGKLEYPVLSTDDDVVTMTPYDEIPDGSYYIHANDLTDPSNFRDLFEGKGYNFESVSKALQLIVGEGAYVVFIAKARSVESFKARLKGTEVTDLKEMAGDVQERINDMMTPEVLRHRTFRLNHMCNRRLALFAPEWIAQIMDEEVRQILTPATDEVVAQNEEAVALWKSFLRFGFKGASVTIPDISYSEEEVDTAIKYPLTENTPFHAPLKVQEHMVRYMNMVYEVELTLVDA
jgi:hypothetical protein